MSSGLCHSELGPLQQFLLFKENQYEKNQRNCEYDVYFLKAQVINVLAEVKSSV